MARDYEQGDTDFWNVAERALGVGYDQAVLKIQERNKPRDPWRAEVRVAPGVSRAENPRSRRAQPSYFSKEGDSKEGVIAQLYKHCRAESIRRAAAQFYDALPYKDQESVTEMARLFLEGQHTVILGPAGDDREEVASQVLQKAYHQTVQGHVESIVDSVNDGDLKDEEAVRDQIDCIEVCYTGRAITTLRYAKNDDAYQERNGEEPLAWEAMASAALQADVEENLGFEPSDVHTVDCARCGEVVATTPKDEDEECPKCGLDLTTEVREGVRGPTVSDHADEQGGPVAVEEPDDRTVCEDCLDGDTEINKERAVPVAPNTLFECAACETTCLTKRAELRAGRIVVICGNDSHLCAKCGEAPTAPAGTPLPSEVLFTCYECGGIFTTPKEAR